MNMSAREILALTPVTQDDVNDARKVIENLRIRAEVNGQDQGLRSLLRVAELAAEHAMMAAYRDENGPER